MFALPAGKIAIYILAKYKVLHVCMLYLRECSHASAMITYPCVYEKDNAPMCEQK